MSARNPGGTDDGRGATRAPSELRAFVPSARRLHALPAVGSEARVSVTLGAMALELDRVPDAIRDAVSRAWSTWTAREGASGAHGSVRVVFRSAREVSRFVPPGVGPERYAFPIVFDEDGTRAATYEAAAAFDARGLRATVAIVDGAEGPSLWRAVENLLRAIAAWAAVESGAGLWLHGAALVRRGSGYLFVGPSGAGKSTLVEGRGDAEAVTDDLACVGLDADGARLYGTPFVGTADGACPLLDPVPLAGTFGLAKGREPRVEPMPELGALALLVANAPFVYGRPDAVAAIAERLLATVPMRRLTFPRTGGFWPAIDAAETA